VSKRHVSHSSDFSSMILRRVQKYNIAVLSYNLRSNVRDKIILMLKLDISFFFAIFFYNYVCLIQPKILSGLIFSNRALIGY
jgi:hypothetical protein